MKAGYISYQALKKKNPSKSKLVRARKVGGLWMGAKNVKIDSQAIVDSIRRDREAR